MEKTNKKQFFWTMTGAIILLAVSAGALAGVIASVYTNRSIDNYIQSLSDGLAVVSISQVKPRPLPGTYEEALERVRVTGWMALAQFTVEGEESKKQTSWIGKDDVFGVGAVVTSDGWILTENSLNVKERLEIDTQVWIAGKSYEIEKVIEDNVSEFIMVKVDAQNLTSLAFGTSNEMHGGEILFVLPFANEIIETSLQSEVTLRKDFVLPSEAFANTWLLKDDVINGPILNSSAELIGFTFDNSTVPLHQILAFVESAIKNDLAVHSAIGANVIDISRVYNMNELLSQGLKYGFVVDSIIEGPAMEAGLEKGDIILSLDEVQLTQTVSLSELITTYEVEDSAIFKILREGEELSIEITFENLQDLVY